MLRPQQHAFFLDLDGTLLEFASRPDQVKADAALLRQLRRLAERSDGALALVSGRTLSDIDALTAPYHLPASGVHGLERRTATQDLVLAEPAPGRALAEARSALRVLHERHPQLLIEDKTVALAVHYRSAPELEGAVRAAIATLAGIVSGELRTQYGSMVVEVLPAGASKATAVASFMGEAPFHGRVPVYVGDDVTDECAFEWVNAHGGVSIAVAPRGFTAAVASLPSVAAVRAWLRLLTAAPKGIR